MARPVQVLACGRQQGVSIFTVDYWHKRTLWLSYHTPFWDSRAEPNYQYFLFRWLRADSHVFRTKTDYCTYSIYFNQLNSLDHIQALVVNDEKVIATEGNHGTKKMLSKLKKKSDGILIKLPKKKQDLRMDLPTIGLNTLKDCKKYGLKGIVLKSKKNIFLDKKKCINFANKNKIFIKIIWKKFLF